MHDFEKLAMDQFRLRWRFTDARYHLLSEHHLNQIAPLHPSSAAELMGMTNGWFKEHPFTRGLFPHMQSIALNHSLPASAKVVRKWLYGCGIPFRRKVYLSWNSTDAVETNWKMVVK
jgi:hypothetical protein